MNKSGIIITIFIVLAILHQDFWNWSNGNLVFGIMPVALAYHAAYSLIAALFWTLVMKFSWPTELEEWADGGGAPVASAVPSPTASSSVTPAAASTDGVDSEPS